MLFVLTFNMNSQIADSIQCKVSDYCVLRSGPSSQSDKIMTIASGEIITVYNVRQKNYFLVKYNQTLGYVNSCMFHLDKSFKDKNKNLQNSINTASTTLDEINVQSDSKLSIFIGATIPDFDNKKFAINAGLLINKFYLDISNFNTSYSTLKVHLIVGNIGFGLVLPDTKLMVIPTIGYGKVEISGSGIDAVGDGLNYGITFKQQSQHIGILAGFSKLERLKLGIFFVIDSN